MALPKYSQYDTPESNILALLAAQAGPNPPIGQEAFAVLAAKALLNIFASVGFTQADADKLYAKLVKNLADLPDKEQALANIGGAKNTPFLQGLSTLENGIVVKTPTGAAARQIEVSSAMDIANSDGQSGNPKLSLVNALEQAAVAVGSMGDDYAWVKRGGAIVGVSLRDNSFGAVPLSIAVGRAYIVLANTQAVFAHQIVIDGQLEIEGCLSGV